MTVIEINQCWHSNYPNQGTLGITTRNEKSKKKELDSLPVAKVCRLTNTAILPRQYTPEATGFDLSADIKSNVTIPAFGQRTIPTGLAIAPPQGTYTQIVERSSLAKIGLHVLAGVIDRDYTGHISIHFTNVSGKDVVVAPGQRVAQLIFIKIESPTIVAVQELEPTTRGVRGTGSTGAFATPNLGIQTSSGKLEKEAIAKFDKKLEEINGRIEDLITLYEADGKRQNKLTISVEKLDSSINKVNHLLAKLLNELVPPPGSPAVPDPLQGLEEATTPSTVSPADRAVTPSEEDSGELVGDQEGLPIKKPEVPTKIGLL